MKPIRSVNPFSRNDQLYQALVGGLRHWVLVLDRQGSILEASDSILQDLQVPRQDLIGVSFWSSPWWKPESLLQVQDRLSKTRLPISARMEVCLPQGQKVMQHFMFTSVGRGKTTTIVVEAFPPQNAFLPEHLLQTALNHPSQGFALLDAEGQLLWAGDSFRKLTEGTDFDPFEAETWEKLTGHPVIAVKPGTSQETDLTLRQGEQQRLAHLTVCALQEPAGYLLRLEDSTEQQRAQKQLEQLESRLSLALKAGGVGIWEWDIHSDTLYWDDRMLELYGTNQEEFSGKLEGWEKLLHPEDASAAVGFTYRVLMGSVEQDIELRVLLPNGLIRHLRCFAGLERSASGQPIRVIGTTWDVTREKLVESGFKEAQEIAQVARWRWNVVEQQFEWSDDLRRLWGYRPDDTLPTDARISELFSTNSWQELQKASAHAIETREGFALDVEYLGKKGKKGWMHIRGRVAENREGQVTQLYGTLQDITENKLARSQLEALSSKLLIATEAGGIGIWEWDAETMCMTLDRRMAELFDVKASHFPHQLDIYALIEHHVHPDDAPSLSETFRNLADHPRLGHDIFRAETRVVVQGQTRILRLHARILPSTNGEVRMLGTAWDITSQKATENLIRHQANYDALTDLPNRRLFYELLSQELKTAARTSKSCALLVIDLDRFKEINDTYGHPAGDQMLIEVANRLRMCIRASDIMARLSGDEFVILLTQLDEAAPSATLVAERILGILRHPYRLSGEQVMLSASIGITVFPDDAEDPNKLMVSADQAMYSAKSEGKNRFRFFKRSMQDTAFEKRRIHNDLGFAIRRNELEMYYQPIVDLVTGQVVKAEALLRWKHPEKGFVSPGIFIPIAEESDLIHALGDWVFKTVTQQVQKWDAAGVPPVEVSVNISAKQFMDPRTMDRLLGYISTAGIAPKRIIVEITESVFVQEKSEIVCQIRQLQEAGIRIALDDFGTGYSSLNYLTRFDTGYIKIDRSFIQGIHQTSEAAIVDAIIAMSHKLGKTVIAEGVETLEQAEWLKDKRCDLVQGYYFARPLPAGDFVAFVEKFAALPPEG
ncbi:bifunctional diguanylate cyclase/phosphodiesterase [Deinococcus cellulosilyticus]|uniref:Diguanylate cyclase n=1 Tax=Deinococcus cellulosilyticus (strain DSM 18568 / NBRC 106333 / KACC 11606 / 5516J-15) TaxID=1223518 RepID=A0A511N2W7_DEIC1|nr:EAL domain-containing protein [Deinococcus cellulosilyticus]GEM46761.1 diguanylate cyclase [Deinococcus cellulosilyticus NBRC 106333 = KACC 11606]